MPDQILKDLTHVASTLAEQAAKQIQSVTDELKGPVGRGRGSDDPQPPQRVNLGTMAFNVMQLASKVGSLLMELSQYDLVRRNIPTLTLRSPNQLTELPLEAGKEYEYKVLVENEGTEAQHVSLKAKIFKPGRERPLHNLQIVGEFGEISASERRAVSVTIPAELEQGKYCLVFTIRDRSDDKRTVIGKKVVDLLVRPLPEQHDNP